jgi:uncharacterized phiE125 gp8 family phage protein
MFSFTSALVALTYAEPLTKDEAKENLHVAHDADDPRIRALIIAAREFVEVWTGRSLVTQAITLKLDCFPSYEDDYTIRLPRGPVSALTSIAYYDTNNVSQTLSSSLYETALTSEPARIRPITTTTWPLTYDRLEAITVTYAAGYATPEAVPERIKQAMYLLVNHWYVNREPVGMAGNEIAFTLQALLGASWTGSIAGTFAQV